MSLASPFKHQNSISWKNYVMDPNSIYLKNYVMSVIYKKNDKRGKIFIKRLINFRYNLSKYWTLPYMLGTTLRFIEIVYKICWILYQIYILSAL